MTTDTANVLVGEGWRDALEASVRGQIRHFIEELLEQELTDAVGRARCAPERLATAASELAGEVDASDAELSVAGHRNGHRLGAPGPRLG
jgi:hypothetical protein